MKELELKIRSYCLVPPVLGHAHCFFLPFLTNLNTALKLAHAELQREHSLSI